MAIARINGPMLYSNLERQGVNLAIDANLAYFDVTNRRLGVNTTSPQYVFDANGSAHLGGLVISANAIVSDTGRINLGSIANLQITGGATGYVIYTDGAGNLAFGNLSYLTGVEGFTGNNIALGTNTQGNLSNVLSFTTTTTVTNAIADINQLLGYITNSAGSVLHASSVIVGNVDVYANLSATASNVQILQANAAVQAVWLANLDANVANATTNITSLQANAAYQATAINSINANIGAYETYANLQISSINANVGAYETYANLQISSINANVGAYESYANLQISNISSNLGAYESYANLQISTINANLGAYETYANAAINSLTLGAYSNANVASYLPVYGGNVLGNYLLGNVLNTDYIHPNTANVVTFNFDSAITLPTGGNSARPASPVAGQIRWNSDTGALEYYNGLGWAGVVNTISGQDFYGDGINSSFTLNNATTSVGIIVSINGVVQQPDAAYSVSGTTITFKDTPLSTDLIDIRYLAAATTPINETYIIQTPYVTITTANTVLDSFLANEYRSAKYTVSGDDGINAHMAEINLTQINGNIAYNVYSLLNTNSNNTITYTANINGGTVYLSAQATLNSNVRIQHTYFAV